MQNSMQQNPSKEASSCSATEDIPCLSWTTMSYYCGHQNLPLVPTLMLMNPAYTQYLLLTFPFTPRFSFYNGAQIF